MLLQCVTCGKDVSSEAKKCPHCGELKFGGYSEFHLFSIQGRVGRMRYFAYSLTYSIDIFPK
jgi:predicted  nucleic acid-binding Zn-ribbon protein